MEKTQLILTFGADVLSFRAKFNLTQKECAKIFGVTPLMVFNYENQKGYPHKKNLIKIKRIMQTITEKEVKKILCKS